MKVHHRWVMLAVVDPSSTGRALPLMGSISPHCHFELVQANKLQKMQTRVAEEVRIAYGKPRNLIQIPFEMHKRADSQNFFRIATSGSSRVIPAS